MVVEYGMLALGHGASKSRWQSALIDSFGVYVHEAFDQGVIRRDLKSFDHDAYSCVVDKVVRNARLAVKQVLEYPSMVRLVPKLALRAYRMDYVDFDRIPMRQVWQVGRSVPLDGLRDDALGFERPVDPL